MSAITAKAVSWTETGYVPDAVIRAGIRRLLEAKRREIRSGDVEYAAAKTNAFVEQMNESPIALMPHLANEQHYEVPSDFFTAVTGDHRKYSCCYWPKGVDTLEQAELAALSRTLQRADIGSGMRILDLGCGWGALSLLAARHFPTSFVTAVSNSSSQREFILQQARDQGLNNIEAITCDMNDFDAEVPYDRIVSVEMFEHMRNWRELFNRISNWLTPDGRFFMHVFCHRSTPYEYTDKGPGDWMSRYFFSGGMMPSADLPLRFAEHLAIEKRWHWNGTHYARTCDAWLERLDAHRKSIHPVFETCYGTGQAELWLQRWRMFFMACSELFAFDEGREWFVGQYGFSRTGT